jgi:hypothetical protein
MVGKPSGDMTVVERAEAVVIDLEQKAEAINERLKQISIERQKIGFAVFADDHAKVASCCRR